MFLKYKCKIHLCLILHVKFLMCILQCQLLSLLYAHSECINFSNFAESVFENDMLTCSSCSLTSSSLFLQQKFSSSLPETVFLAINQKGIHFLKSKHANVSRKIFDSFYYCLFYLFCGNFRSLTDIHVKNDPELGRQYFEFILIQQLCPSI